MAEKRKRGNAVPDVPESPLLDRVIGVISPEWRKRRELARYQCAHIQTARSYDAAKVNRERKKQIDNRAPDDVTQDSIPAIRGRARTQEQNHDLARGLLTTLVTQVIGPGIRSAPQLRNKRGELATRTNRRLAQLWRMWGHRPETTGEYDWPEIQRRVFRTMIRDGEIFAQDLLGRVPEHQHASVVPYSLELMEAEFCPIDFHDKTRRIRQGIRRSRWGKPVEYYFFKDDPREGFFLSGVDMNISKFATGSSDVVPLRADRVHHLKMTDRIRQSRGVSLFAALFTRLSDVKDFEEAERMAARIGASFAFAIQKTPEYEASTTHESGQLREIGLAPGIIFDNLAPGEQVESIKNERPNNQIQTFRSEMLKAVAAGAGASYASISNNYDGNYSSQRQEMLESSLVYDTMRSFFIQRFVDQVWRRFIDMVELSGLVSFRGIDRETLYNVEHRGQGTPYIDPAKEAKADRDLIRAGIMSREATILRRGGDPEETRAQIIEERDRDYEDGLVFSSDAAHEADVQLPLELGETEDADTDSDTGSSPGSAGGAGSGG